MKRKSYMNNKVLEDLITRYIKERYTSFSLLCYDIADIVIDSYEEDKSIADLVENEANELLKSEKWTILEYYCNPETADLKQAIRCFKRLIENVVINYFND